MDTGRVAEFDEPHSLLQNETGIFYSMVEALGPQELRRLSEIAKDKYDDARSVEFEEMHL